MTPRGPPWTIGEHDIILICEPIAAGYPPPTPTWTVHSCARCGRVVWVVTPLAALEPGAQIHYICSFCFVDVAPPGVLPGVSPTTRAAVERREGPVDWDARIRETLDGYRHAD